MDEVRALVGDDLILWGGVPGAMLVPNYSEGVLKEHVTRYLDTMKRTGRFVLGIGDQLPPNGDIDRIAMIAGLVETYDLT